MDYYLMGVGGIFSYAFHTEPQEREIVPGGDEDGEFRLSRFCHNVYFCVRVLLRCKDNAFPLKAYIIFLKFAFVKSKLTIVIPVYERAHLVGATLRSLEEQTVRDLNIILVDNGSKDDTLRVLKQWAEKMGREDFHVEVIQETTPGACAARNRGLEAVKTPYVAFFDSDDILFPDYAREIVDAFEASPQSDVLVFEKCVRTGENERKSFHFHNPRLWRSQVINSSLSTQTMAMRTEIARKSGGWNEELAAWQDWEFGVRILLRSPNLCILRRPLALVIPQEESITGTSYSKGAGRWEKSVEAAREAIRASGHKDSHYIEALLDCKLMALCGIYAREGAKSLADRLYEDVMKRTIRSTDRLIFKWERWAVSRGIPGAATIASCLISSNR